MSLLCAGGGESDVDEMDPVQAKINAEVKLPIYCPLAPTQSP
jgi:hypothetical protein